MCMFAPLSCTLAAQLSEQGVEGRALPLDPHSPNFGFLKLYRFELLPPAEWG